MKSGCPGGRTGRTGNGLRDISHGWFKRHTSPLQSYVQMKKEGERERERGREGGTNANLSHLKFLVVYVSALCSKWSGREEAMKRRRRRRRGPACFSSEHTAPGWVCPSR